MLKIPEKNQPRIDDTWLICFGGWPKKYGASFPNSVALQLGPFHRLQQAKSPLVSLRFFVDLELKVK